MSFFLNTLRTILRKFPLSSLCTSTDFSERYKSWSFRIFIKLSYGGLSRNEKRATPTFASDLSPFDFQKKKTRCASFCSCVSSSAWRPSLQSTRWRATFRSPQCFRAPDQHLAETTDLLNLPPLSVCGKMRESSESLYTMHRSERITKQHCSFDFRISFLKIFMAVLLLTFGCHWWINQQLKLVTRTRT